MTENETMKRVLEKAIDHYGKSNQVVKTYEEVGEFLQAMCKFTYLADRHNEWKKATSGTTSAIEDRYLFQDIEQGEKHLREEIADCIIMFEQMRLIYGPEEVDWWINFKLERLDDRIERGKKGV